MTPSSSGWTDRAEAHFATALRESAVADDLRPNPQAVIHHAHGCVQALLRARLAEAGIPFPETAYLVVLLYLCVDLEPAWEQHREAIRTLTTRFMDTEDPANPIPPERIQESLAFCRVFRDLALGVNGN